MKVTVEQVNQEREEELIVRCHDPSEAWVEAVRETASGQRTVCGWREDTLHRVKLSEIFYFEVVDDRSFLRRKRNCMSLSGCARAALYSAAASPWF